MQNKQNPNKKYTTKTEEEDYASQIINLEKAKKAIALQLN
jgi:hypothetical protein